MSVASLFAALFRGRPAPLMQLAQFLLQVGQIGHQRWDGAFFTQGFTPGAAKQKFGSRATTSAYDRSNLAWSAMPAKNRHASPSLLEVIRGGRNSLPHLTLARTICGLTERFGR